jgi:hypothetical protein
MPYKYSPLLKEDLESDPLSLHLDQNIPQTILNGAPIFEEGICIGNATTYFRLNGNVLSLYVNGIVRQTWTTTPSTSSGESMGLLLTLTYA